MVETGEVDDLLPTELDQYSHIHKEAINCQYIHRTVHVGGNYSLIFGSTFGFKIFVPITRILCVELMGQINRTNTCGFQSENCYCDYNSDVTINYNWNIICCKSQEKRHVSEVRCDWAITKNTTFLSCNSLIVTLYGYLPKILDFLAHVHVIYIFHSDGLVQERRSSIANALELRLSALTYQFTCLQNDFHRGAMCMFAGKQSLPCLWLWSD